MAEKRESDALRFTGSHRASTVAGTHQLYDGWVTVVSAQRSLNDVILKLDGGGVAFSKVRERERKGSYIDQERKEKRFWLCSVSGNQLCERMWEWN